MQHAATPACLTFVYEADLSDLYNNYALISQNKAATDMTLMLPQL